MAHRSDEWLIANKHNTARFFTENRHIAWVALFLTLAWGTAGYLRMPQRKDPDIPIKVALAIVQWPGVEAERVEELVTRRVEEVIAENVNVQETWSTTRVGAAFVFIMLKEEVDDPAKPFDDILLRLNAIRDLPDGAGPLTFIKDFGSTVALMLTVASPKVGEAQIGVRADAITRSLTALRASLSGGAADRAAIVFNVPASSSDAALRRPADLFAAAAARDGVFRDARVAEGAGFVIIDGATRLDDAGLLVYAQNFLESRLRASDIHPDAWPPAVVRDPGDAYARLTATAGDKYSYREMDEYTDLIRRTLQTLPIVTKISRDGLLDEEVTLSYSQERLASYGIKVGTLGNVLRARNTPAAGGVIDIGGKSLAIAPTGEFRTEREIGDVIMGATRSGTPIYLRDLVEVQRSYRTPPRLLNFYTWRDSAGHWQRNRAITLGIQMRSGAKISEFGEQVDSTLEVLRARLPEDLIFARTSDQPRQVEESVALFMDSLIEAIVLVVLVAFIGFMEWRSALLMALSIPVTLAMTFAAMSMLHLDLQSVSIASLILALGLLVDDPVVAGDAIKRDLSTGQKRIHAAWLGPTRLGTAILFATITNIVAYLPFLLLPGNSGRFIFTLPVVLTSSLVASRLVSMTFIPLLGYYLLRPDRKGARPIAERRTRGFTGAYCRIATWAIDHRWRVFAGSLAILALGGVIGKRLRSQFFPKDLAALSTVNIWLPEDAAISATRQIAAETEAVIRDVADNWEQQHPGEKRPEGVLRSITAFVGGGGPRFWFSNNPEPPQSNYALLIVEVHDKRDTPRLVEALQLAVTARVTGARVDVEQLESGVAVGLPVAVRISGDDMATLRAQAERLKRVLRGVPIAERIQDDWGAEALAVQLNVDPDRANLAGLTNADVSVSTSVALNGYGVGVLREGDKQIPIVTRLRTEERAQLADIQNLYVFSAQSDRVLPLRQIAALSYGMHPAKIARRSQFRTITVGCFPTAGHLASEIISVAMPQIQALARELPPGFKLEVAGEYKEQLKSNHNMSIVMGVSVLAIFVALVVQFRNAVKPLLVFGAIPYGVVGALTALWVMGAPFGFMAFLGVASLVGVIVSHVIVLFDFIEEAREKGEPLKEALVDAGIVRLRPVMITVSATVLALVPLSIHGGQFWQPLCYAQIGGLTFATFVTLLLVPVLYAIFVLDLKIVKWETPAAHD
jgi:multidrug efflux pump